MKPGDLIKAKSKIGCTIISGEVIGCMDGLIIVHQSNGVTGYINKRYFTVEVVKEGKR